MKIQDVEFCTTDWAQVPVTEHAGEVGMALWRTLEQGNVRVRMVEYTPGYVADHWCERGHVLLVLDGELVTELRDGRRVVLREGTSYQVADGAMAHRSSSPRGAAPRRTLGQRCGGSDLPPVSMPFQATGPVLEPHRRRSSALSGNSLAQRPLAPAFSSRFSLRPFEKLRCARG